MTTTRTILEEEMRDLTKDIDDNFPYAPPLIELDIRYAMIRVVEAALEEATKSKNTIEELQYKASNSHCGCRRDVDSGYAICEIDTQERTTKVIDSLKE